MRGSNTGVLALLLVEAVLALVITQGLWRWQEALPTLGPGSMVVLSCASFGVILVTLYRGLTLRDLN